MMFRRKQKMSKKEIEEANERLIENPHGGDNVDRMIENYFILEVAAIPPNFELHQYLSMRESVGIFENKGINLKEVNIIIEGIKHSPVFAVMNNPRISLSSCVFVLQLLHELNLVIESIPNPLKRSGYKDFLKYHDPDSKSPIWFDSQGAKTLNFVIINMFHMMSEDIYKDVVGKSDAMEVYQKKLENDTKHSKLK